LIIATEPSTMPSPKPRSAKLPLLIALPVLLAIGVAVVFLIPNDPPPQPQPPEPLLSNDEPAPIVDKDNPLVGPDPRPRPRPKPGAPSEVAVAKAMEGEAGAAMEAIRSRLELKFKYAEYKLDRSWTLEQVMRRPDALSGTHFAATDYSLSFPDGEDPQAVITCATIQGRELPDGALTLTLNLRTGDAKRQGRILARNAAGYVLLGDSEYREISEALRAAVLDHVLRQDGVASGLAEFKAVSSPPDSMFVSTDFTIAGVKEAALAVDFTCHSIGSEELAHPAVISIDYATRTVKLSASNSPDWIAPPRDRERFTRRSHYLFMSVSDGIVARIINGGDLDEIRPEGAHRSHWSWAYSEVMPFDVKIVEGTANRVVLEVATSFGRPLPFAKVRYVAEPGAGKFEFED
jgi:hypothetical protein